MLSLRSVAQSILFAILVLVALTAGGCVPASPDMAPEMVHDPADYMPVELPEPTAHWQGEMAGEVTQNSAILQARLSQDGKVRSRDVEGQSGVAALALSTGDAFADAFRTRWMVASPDGDCIVKTEVEGFEEFSVGALVDANSRIGRRPGEPESTDPEGLISQPYVQEERSGGFLEVTVRPPAEEHPATSEFAFYDELGTLLYVSEKDARPSQSARD